MKRASASLRPTMVARTFLSMFPLLFAEVHSAKARRSNTKSVRIERPESRKRNAFPLSRTGGWREEPLYNHRVLPGIRMNMRIIMDRGRARGRLRIMVPSWTFELRGKFLPAFLHLPDARHRCSAVSHSEHGAISLHSLPIPPPRHPACRTRTCRASRFPAREPRLSSHEWLLGDMRRTQKA